MDRDIRAAVYEELVTDPLIDADDIVVGVFNGDVPLDGTVPSQAERSEAAAVAQRVAGVTVVHNLPDSASPIRSRSGTADKGPTAKQQIKEPYGNTALQDHVQGWLDSDPAQGLEALP